MSDSIAPNPKRSGKGAWEIPAAIDNCSAIIGSGEVGLCCFCAAPFEWAEHRDNNAHIIIPFAPALCELAWRDVANAEPHHDRLVGRQICFIAPGVPRAVSWKCKAEIFLLLVRPSLVERELGERWAGVVVGEFAAVVSKDRMVWWLTTLCRRLLQKGDPKDHPLIEEIGHGLARLLITIQFHAPEKEGQKATVLSPVQLQKVTDYVEADWRRVPRVDDLADLVGLSRVHFSRVFKNTSGVSPARYQKICRMHKAQEMLRSGNYRIEEVAKSLGFDDASYFSRCFRQDFDMSPTQYLEDRREEIS